MAPDDGVPEKFYNVVFIDESENQLPDSSSSGRHEPLMGSPSQTPRSSSAKDRSDAKDIRRNQSGS
jgi:hypothetical protein